ncbi:MAG: hypothetical protein ACXVEE_27270 [Polyangiales bacterium]
MNAVLLLVLAQDPAADSAASAMAASAADGLDGRVHVELERVTTLPADDEAIHRGTAVKAGAVIEVSWPDADGRRAHLHAHLRPTAAWIDRDVTFELTSSPWERGRAVGLAIAAMLPDDEPSPPPAPEPPQPLPVIVTPPTVITTVTPPVDRPVAVTPPKRPSPYEASLVGELGTGISGGARAGFTWWLVPRVGLHLDVGGRASTVRAVNANVLRLDAGVGTAIRLYGLAGGTSFVVYGEVRGVREQVTRGRTDGVEERHARFLPAFAFSGEFALAVTQSMALTAAVGGDLSLGKTTLAVNETNAATVPVFTAISAVGLRFTF